MGGPQGKKFIMLMCSAESHTEVWTTKKNHSDKMLIRLVTAILVLATIITGRSAHAVSRPVCACAHTRVRACV